MNTQPIRSNRNGNSDQPSRWRPAWSRRSPASAPTRARSRATATFEELDIDSLDLVELAQIVEDEYGVVLKGEDMKELKTVGDAVDLIVARAA